MNSDLPSSALPELQHAELDTDDLDCVLADLDDFAEVIEIQGRDPAGKLERLHDLLRARDGFHARRYVALQILYRFADQTWSDTLLRTAKGAKLVRMPSPARAVEHEAPP